MLCDLKTILIVFQMFLSTTNICSNVFRSQSGPLNRKAVLKTIWFHTFHKQRETRTCEINGAAQQQSCSDINYIYTTAETKQKTILAGWRAGGDVTFPLWGRSILSLGLIHAFTAAGKQHRNFTLLSEGFPQQLYIYVLSFY